jgi:hypothetical protein
MTKGKMKEIIVGIKVSSDIVHPKTKEVILKNGNRITEAKFEEMWKAGIRNVG